MHEARSLRRSYAFDSARAARDFFNAVAALAETEGHHPNVHWHGRNRGRELSLELTTYVVHGLTENDFVLAAKIDALTPKAASTPTASATNP
jgi:4a-hydroxytetrahydrobiopterin dehydratase